VAADVHGGRSGAGSISVDPARPVLASGAFAVEEIPHADGSVCVKVTGDVDFATAPEVRAALQWFAFEGRPTTLDLSGVEFMDSTALRVVLAASIRARDDGWKFLLGGGVSPHIARRFAMTGLSDVLPFASPSLELS
jgi:anti-anti-sigma factor